MSDKGKQTQFELKIGAKDGFSGVFGRFSAMMGRVDKSTRKVRSAWGQLERTGKCVTGTFGTMAKGLALFTGASGGLAAMTKNLGGLAAATANSASRVGMSLETWQEYAYAAEQAGVKTSELESAIGSLGDKAKATASGDGDSAFLLKRLGQAQAPSVILTHLAAKIKALKDAGKDAAAADLAKSFGVANMLPLLEQGSQDLEDIGTVRERVCISGKRVTTIS